MGTIVVGWVDRPEGKAALDRAIDEAKLRGATLLIVHSNKGGTLHDPEAAIETEDELFELRESLTASGVPHEIRPLVRGNDAPEDIVEVAEEVGADFIVIGLRRRSPVGKLILGSNAQRILLDANCPVLAVKAE